MIGDPSILFLDEPTSGLDPAARKHLWDTVSEERDRGKCVFITSHRYYYYVVTNINFYLFNQYLYTFSRLINNNNDMGVGTRKGLVNR